MWPSGSRAALDGQLKLKGTGARGRVSEGALHLGHLGESAGAVVGTGLSCPSMCHTLVGWLELGQV